MPWAQRGSTLDDASFLDRTDVYGVVRITQEEHVRGALALARARGLKVSAAGVRHSMGGRFFLPYQLHYTPQQLERSYPKITSFFRTKRRYDPDHLLTNTWYETYAHYWP